MNFNFSKENLIETEKSKTLLFYWFKRIFIDDWVMKLVALIITITLWLGVTGLQQTATRTLSNVVLNPLLAQDFEITNEFIQEVDIEVTGDGNKVDNLVPRDLVVTYNITDLGAGERETQLTTQNINVDLPPGVTVTKIIPDKVNLRIEKIEEAEIPVKAATNGDLLENYEIYSTKIIPDKVRVRGPKSFVEKLSFITTEEIDLSGRRGDFTIQKIAINVGDFKKISLVEAVAVTAAFKVGKKRIEKLFDVPYEVGEKKGRASVTLYGESEIVETVSIEDIQVVEDPENSNTLRISLPDDIRNSVEIRTYDFNR